jgi:hypothetical protein
VVIVTALTGRQKTYLRHRMDLTLLKSRRIYI